MGKFNGNAPESQEPKLVSCCLVFYYGGFDGDTVGFDVSAPFVVPRVGDYINHRLSSSLMAFDDLKKGEEFQVTDVMHSFQRFDHDELGDSEIRQYVHVCLTVAKRPE